MKAYTEPPRQQCNNCKKFMDKKVTISLTKITYNVKPRQKKIATLCPDCMQELEELYSLKGK